MCQIDRYHGTFVFFVLFGPQWGVWWPEDSTGFSRMVPAAMWPKTAWISSSPSLVIKWSPETLNTTGPPTHLIFHPWTFHYGDKLWLMWWGVSPRPLMSWRPSLMTSQWTWARRRSGAWPGTPGKELSSAARSGVDILSTWCRKSSKNINVP